jgi:bla regulator protein blaR1
MTLALKATVVMLGAIVILHLARRAAASFRHLVIVAAFGALLLLPLVSLSMPQRVITVQPRFTRTLTHEISAATAAPVPRRPQFDIIPLVKGIYFGGVAVSAAPLLFGIWRMRRLRPRVRTQRIAFSHEIAVPVTFGVIRPVILLPSAAERWSDEEVRRSIRHEIAHISRADWLTQIASRFVCTLYWPHPLVWFLWRKLRLEAERACDDAVIRNCANRIAYAEQLVSLARTFAGRSFPALAMSARTHLGLRVDAILDERRERSPLSRRSAISIAALAGVVMLAIAPFKLMSAPAHARSLDLPLLRAAQRGDLERMHDLLDRGADVDAVIPGDGSPLIAAARHGQIDAVNLLVDRGAEVDLGVPGDGNALIMAAAAGELDAMGVLLDRGASIDEIVPGDENALITASANGQTDAVRLLIERGANVNARVRAENEWRTPLAMARRNGHAGVETLLLSAGARQ